MHKLIPAGFWLSVVAGLPLLARAEYLDLPEGYIPVPYIESTGAQSVPIGYSPTKDTALEFAFTTLTYNDGDTFFGASWGGSAYLLTEQNNKFCFWLQSSYTQVGGAFKSNTDYFFSVTNKTSTMTTAGEDPYVVENLPLNNSYGSLYLFGFSGGHRCKYRFKRMKIWDSAGGTLKRDLVPCIQKSEGGTLTAGVYDLANAKFYPDTIKTTPIKTGDLWFEVGDIPQQEYDGVTPCRPEPTVTRQLTGATMQKNVDYELSYENNDRIGTATVTICGLGKYADATLTRTFTIVEKKFRMQFAQAIPDQIFDEVHAVEPRDFITIIDSEAAVGTPLTEGEDYELEFRDNDGIGTAMVVAHGKNSYEGQTAVTSFNIIHDPELPLDGYVRLKWLRDNGSQMVPINYVPGTTTAVSNFSFRFYKAVGSQVAFAQGYTGNQYLLQRQKVDSNWTLNFFGSRTIVYLGDPYGHDLLFSMTPTGDDKGTATLVMDGGEPIVSAGHGLSSGSSTLNIFSSSGHGNPGYIEFRTMEIWKAGVLQRNLIPCRRLSDHALGLYDLANKVFYYDSSSPLGFTDGGPVVTTNMSVGAVADAWILRGTPYRPEITVTDVEKGETLTEGTDYKIFWQTEPQTGSGTKTYYVYAVGIGAYYGAYAFTSYKMYLPTFSIAPIPNAMYSAGSPYRPEVTVTDDGSGDRLEEGTDYRLKWPDDSLSGDVTLKVVGINRYVGFENTTTYRLLLPQTVDEYFDASTAPQSAYTIGKRRIYVFDYTDGGEICVVPKQAMTLGEALIVGGGGAGGTCIGGGGGGGGVLSPKPNKAIAAGTRMSVTVGGGGIIQPEDSASWKQGRNGDASVLDLGDGDRYRAFGGGGGGPYTGSPRAATDGNPLASGGGFGDENSKPGSTDGVHYSSSQGNPGGNASSTGSGGGGGAGLGQSGGAGAGGLGGNGGMGVTNTITGRPVYGGYPAVYGSGGGGGAGNSCTTPGKGAVNAGDGSAKGSGKQGGNAVNGFGGGGGGGSYSGPTKGGAGGHGRVILSFFAGDTSGKTLAVEPLTRTLSCEPAPRVYDPSNPTKVLVEGVDFRYRWVTDNPKAKKDAPASASVIAIGMGDYEGVSADTWYDYYLATGTLLRVR